MTKINYVAQKVYQILVKQYGEDRLIEEDSGFIDAILHPNPKDVGFDKCYYYAKNRLFINDLDEIAYALAYMFNDTDWWILCRGNMGAWVKQQEFHEKYNDLDWTIWRKDMERYKNQNLL